MANTVQNYIWFYADCEISLIQKKSFRIKIRTVGFTFRFASQRQVMPDLDDDGGSDREDELPQVVVLKSGDLTAEEVKTIKDGKDDQAPSKGKILFKKPAKRSSSDKFQGITATSSKKKKSEAGKGGEEGKTGSKVKNNSLLSFGGDEDEED
uniref:Zgc:77056 n=1 Tax=Nothobranchius furzeri TaxID=105023 RepID=A0A8C6NKH4_NOTFU